MWLVFYCVYEFDECVACCDTEEEALRIRQAILDKEQELFDEWVVVEYHPELADDPSWIASSIASYME